MRDREKIIADEKSILASLGRKYQSYLTANSKVKAAVERETVNGEPWCYSSATKQLQTSALWKYRQYRDYAAEYSDILASVKTFVGNNDPKPKQFIINTGCCIFSWWQRAPQSTAPAAPFQMAEVPSAASTTASPVNPAAVNPSQPSLPTKGRSNTL